MNNAAVLQDLKVFIGQYKTEFENLPYRYSSLFEVIGLMVVVEKLKKKGYSAEPRNLIDSKFRIKLTAKGYPKNFSHFECTKGNRSYEVHCNLLVQGAAGYGRYCVDVGIIKKGAADFSGKLGDWKGVGNHNLASFAEMKKLNIYPMLVAQFIGIVYQIMRKCVTHGKSTKPVISPLLMAEGYLTPSCLGIRQGIAKEGMRIEILTNAAFEGKKAAQDYDL